AGTSPRWPVGWIGSPNAHSQTKYNSKKRILHGDAMARIVLGIGSSHTPMHNAQLDDWPRFIELDRLRQHLDKQGRPVSYDQLLALAGERIAPELTPDVLTHRYGAALSHVEALAAVLQRAELDALVVIGDDQKELYQTHNLPSVLV